jgi:tetratricopeptide (TPR) repeat protein
VTARCALVLVLAIAGSAAADVPQARRKGVPERLAKAARDAFEAAAAADAAGDLRTALTQYERAAVLAPHPSTVYNIADVQRRLALLDLAIHSYERYLALAPDASDRTEVAALIDTLAATPGTLHITTKDARHVDAIDLASAYVLVDGELRKRPGPVPAPKHGSDPRISLSVAAGEHVVDLVTPFSYATRECRIEPGGQATCELAAPPRIDGNVVVSGAGRQLDVTPGGRGNDRMFRRFELSPGAHPMLVGDRGYGCSTILIDAVREPAVRYVFVAASGYRGLKRCRAIEVKQQRLDFPR